MGVHAPPRGVDLGFDTLELDTNLSWLGVAVSDHQISEPDSLPGKNINDHSCC